MISFFKLTGVSLGLYISVASATPLLEARAVADPNVCGKSQWLRRECVSPKIWRDLCSVTLREGFPPVQSDVYSTCPDNTVCENIVDEDSNKSIKCVDTIAEPPRKSSTVKTPTSSSQEPQVAFTDEKLYAPSPQKIIIGKIQGKEITLCQGNKNDDADCYPGTGRFSVKKEDSMNFTWGLTDPQVELLALALWRLCFFLVLSVLAYLSTCLTNFFKFLSTYAGSSSS